MLGVFDQLQLKFLGPIGIQAEFCIKLFAKICRISDATQLDHSHKNIYRHCAIQSSRGIAKGSIILMRLIYMYLFNSFPYLTGCNCFSHSTNCVYNATVDSLRLSISRNGSYSGGGVCLNCQVILMFISQSPFA